MSEEFKLSVLEENLGTYSGPVIANDNGIVKKSDRFEIESSNLASKIPGFIDVRSILTGKIWTMLLTSMVSEPFQSHCQPK